MTEITAGLNVVLLGRKGAGKSSTGNTILGRQAFIARKSSRSVTRDVAVESGSFYELPVRVYDTPGFSDTEEEPEIQLNYQNLFQKCESGPCVFLLVIKADSFTGKERKTVEKIEKLLGEERLKKTWILFTRGDELEDENTTIKEFINETEPLKDLIQKYDQRYHVFNNNIKGPSDQVQMLLKKILKTHIDIQVREEPLKPNPLMRKIPDNIEPDAPPVSLSSRRIVLLGKTGVGKSAAGNTILGQREFNSVMSTSSVTSECSVKHTTVSGRSVSIVDTPGLFDTEMSPEELMTEIARSVYLSSPGPHAFLIVFPVNMRFTEQEQQIPQMIEMMFGEEVLKYSIILFTHGDLLEKKPIKKLIEENCRLRDLVDQCGGRFHIFNNKDVNNRDQVNDLLKKIDTMIEQNGGGHYSNQMYEDAQRFRREEEEQRQREEEERKQVEKQVQEKMDKVGKETEERFRAEMEAVRKKSEREMSQSGFFYFISKYKRYLQMAAFVVCGIIIGALVLTGVGAAVGAAIGAGVTAVSVGGGTLSASICGATLSASVGAAATGAAATGAAATGAASTGAAATGAAATGAAAMGAAIGAGIGAAVGAVGGGVVGAVVGVAVTEDSS